MPYIDPSRRHRAAVDPCHAGELNYAITLLLLQYLRYKGKSYGTVNEIMGVLECAGAEFYRRVAVPYEDEKCHLNGDVYDV